MAIMKTIKKSNSEETSSCSAAATVVEHAGRGEREKQNRSLEADVPSSLPTTPKAARTATWRKARPTRSSSNDAVFGNRWREAKAKMHKSTANLVSAEILDQDNKRAVNSFIKSLKTGVKSGVQSAVKVGQDTRIRFSVDPFPGDPGYNQWKDAMKMVARLPEGVPTEFRKKLWLTLSERYLTSRGVDWAKAERFCFNEWSNPDDDELGLQIVRDLHRTGCSLFCGDDASANQLMLKRVLLAYARWNKSIGYCQGFNMLAAIILEVMEKSESEALKVMIFMIEGILPEGYFTNNLRGLSVDMAVFRELLKLRLPKLSKHLDELQQKDGRDGTGSGTSYEPPLTNVFTMQWFLTLFSTCLPRDTVLRVWDLILLEGNEVLLRTALAIWKGLQDHILEVGTADEFYCVMGQLSQEMLQFGSVDSNRLIKDLVEISPFPFTEVPELREKFTYNITPWSQGLAVAKRGLKILYSDDEDYLDDEEDEEKIAVAATFGISAVFKSPKSPAKSASRDSRDSAGGGGGGGGGSSGSSVILGMPKIPAPASTRGPSQQNVDRERLTVDISALRKQYSKLRQRQKQAQIILSSAMTRHHADDDSSSDGHAPSVASSGTTPPAPIAMNHLLLGKKPLVGSKPRRGPPPGAVPPKPNKKPQQPVPVASSSAPPGASGMAPTVPITANQDSEADVKATEGAASNGVKAAAANSATKYSCPQPEILPPADGEAETRPPPKSQQQANVTKKRSSSSSSSGRERSPAAAAQSPARHLGSPSAARKRSSDSSTTEQGGGAGAAGMATDQEEDVTENDPGIEEIPRDPDSVSILTSKLPGVEEEESAPSSVENAATAHDEVDCAGDISVMETPTSSLAVEYLDKRKAAAENSKKALQIIKENSEILDKILRKKQLHSTLLDGQQQDNSNLLVDLGSAESEASPAPNNDVNFNQSQQQLKEAANTNGAQRPHNTTPVSGKTGNGRVIGYTAPPSAPMNPASKPITFNPFPKPVMRKKKTEVGKKLGLYSSK